jgi:hypothetical protein
VDGRDTHTAEGERVVYVNPVTMGSATWGNYLKETKANLHRGKTVNSLVSVGSCYTLI